MSQEIEDLHCAAIGKLKVLIGTILSAEKHVSENEVAELVRKPLFDYLRPQFKISVSEGVYTDWIHTVLENLVEEGSAERRYYTKR